MFHVRRVWESLAKYVRVGAFALQFGPYTTDQAVIQRALWREIDERFVAQLNLVIYHLAIPALLLRLIGHTRLDGGLFGPLVGACALAPVVVVDEAVLALTGYRVPDPIDVFYGRRAPGVDDHHLRAHVQLAAPEDLSEIEEELGASAAYPGASVYA